MADDAQNINLSPEKFLYVFTPTKTDKVSFCDISLETSVRIISVITILTSFHELYKAFIERNLFYMITSICLSLFFLVISFYIFMSTINNNSSYCKVGYHIFSIIFLIETLIYLIEAGLMCLGFINPYGADFFKMKATLFTVGEGVILIIYGWCLWELYCYYILLKEINIGNNNCNNNNAVADRHDN